MLVSKELEQAINDEIGREFYASLQYINIATYFDEDNLPNLPRSSTARQTKSTCTP